MAALLLPLLGLMLSPDMHMWLVSAAPGEAPILMMGTFVQVGKHGQPVVMPPGQAQRMPKEHNMMDNTERQRPMRYRYRMKKPKSPAAPPDLAMNYRQMMDSMNRASPPTQPPMPTPTALYMSTPTSAMPMYHAVPPAQVRRAPHHDEEMRLQLEAEQQSRLRGAGGGLWAREAPKSIYDILEEDKSGAVRPDSSLDPRAIKKGEGDKPGQNVQLYEFEISAGDGNQIQTLEVDGAAAGDFAFDDILDLINDGFFTSDVVVATTGGDELKEA